MLLQLRTAVLVAVRRISFSLLGATVACTGCAREAPDNEGPAVIVDEAADLAETGVTRLASDESPVAETKVRHAGELLAERHCSRCHLVPLPSDLPMESWDFIMQWMGHYFGYESLTGGARSVVLAELVPEFPTVDRATLDSILDYYETSAAPELPPEKVAPQKLPSNELFAPSPLQLLPRNRSVTAVRYDERRQRLLIGDARANRIWEFTASGTPLARYECHNTQPVGVAFVEDGFVATLIGHFMLDGDAGRAMRVKTTSGEMETSFPVQDFYRTVNCQVVDLDGDGHLDYLMSGFGARMYGSFSIFWGEEDGTTKRQDMTMENGTIGSQLADFDEDGDLDILVMTAQGHHELFLFTNQGGRRFGRSNLWKKRPSFGTNGFRLIDLDGDGHQELVVFCGNNMEMAEPPTRPYHGVYVYEQVRSSEPLAFELAFFQPLPGAVGVAAADLDGDGDIDLASASASPDWRVRNPTTAIVLTNLGGLQFEPSELAGATGYQWTCVEAADIDQDGAVELVFGKLDFASALDDEELANFTTASKEQPAVLILDRS